MLAKFVKPRSGQQRGAEYILRAMCTYVKQYGPYTDRTGNLRNSISINLDTMQEWPADTPAEVLKSLVPKTRRP